MNYKIIAIQEFKRDAKKLVKKYTSLKQELVELQNQLMQNPRMGVLIHENIYKIRLAVKSKGKGKSGGLRIITYVVEIELQISEDTKNEETTIFLVAIYDKSKVENISNKDLKSLIDEINTELDEKE